MELSKAIASVALISYVSITAYFSWRSKWFGVPPELKRAKILYDKIYKNINTLQIAYDEYHRLDLNDASYTYGEVVFDDFIHLLDITDPQSGEVFYDLGSGAGRPSIIAALAYPLGKVRGVEKIPALHDLSMKIKNKFIQHDPTDIDFIQDDMLNVDIQDADIVFINATCYMGEFWDNVVEKLTALKPGTRLIISTKSLPEEHFKIITESQFKMSWNYCFVTVYEKR